MGGSQSKTQPKSELEKISSAAVAPSATGAVAPAAFTPGEIADKKYYADTEEKLFKFYLDLYSDKQLMKRKDRIHEINRRAAQLDSSLKLYKFNNAKWLKSDDLVEKNHQMRDDLIKKLEELQSKEKENQKQ